MRLRLALLLISVGLVATACSASEVTLAGESTTTTTPTTTEPTTTTSTTTTAPTTTTTELPIDGVEIINGLSKRHADEVSYDDLPPAGGRHLDIWQNCGVYDAEVELGNLMHTLEHGVVWITYGSDVGAADVATLVEAAQDNIDRIVVAPLDQLGEEIWAVAWGRRLQLDGADDLRLHFFISTYVNGRQSPEPGASCRGGLGA